MADSSYLTSAAPDLSSLGRKKDHLYYTEQEAELVEAESQCNFGKYRKSLNSKTFGSIGEVLLPNLDFVGQVFLHLRIPALAINQLLTSSWGLGCIASINIQLGNSNISLQEKLGYTNWHENYWSCETKEKRDFMMGLAGSRKLVAASFNDHDAIICLNTAFSTLRNIVNKRPYDTNTLSSPILIQVSFKPITGFISVVKDTVAGLAYSTLPTQFSVADIIIRQDVLTDKSMSLKNTLMTSNMFTVYPYTHVLSGTQSTQTVTVINNIGKFNIDMTGFLNSDLLGISFHIIDTACLNGVIDSGSPENNTMPNPFSTHRCRDIRVIFNGSILHDMRHYSHDLLLSSMTKGNVHVSNKETLNTGLDNGGAPDNAHVYYLPFTKDLRAQFTDMLMNTPRYSQQPLSIDFCFEDVDGTRSYTFQSSYYYNAVTLTSKGNSNIFFT